MSVSTDGWDLLLGRIKEGKCMPFLGAGACAGVLPLGGEIALRWSAKYGYPFEDSSGDLVRVAKFLALKTDKIFVREVMVEELSSVKTPDFKAPNSVHGVLADLPLPVYMTTNYDNFMFDALKAKGKNPRRDFCRWHKIIRDLDRYPSVLSQDRGYVPSESEPLVYHLHGVLDVLDSMVVSEDDYLRFLDALRDPDLIHPHVQVSLQGSTMLFMGYSLADWDFLIILRRSSDYLPRTCISVGRMSVRGAKPGMEDKAWEHLVRDLESKGVLFCWMDCRDFAAELARRWKAS